MNIDRYTSTAQLYAHTSGRKFAAAVHCIYAATAGSASGLNAAERQYTSTLLVLLLGMQLPRGISGKLSTTNLSLHFFPFPLLFALYRIE